MAFREAARAARCAISGDPLKSSHFGKRRGLLATTFSPKSQASPRISARAHNRLTAIEERIGLLGRVVSLGQAGRGLLVTRLRTALGNAGLDVAVRR